MLGSVLIRFALLGITLALPIDDGDELYINSLREMPSLGRVQTVEDYAKLGIDVKTISPLVIEDGFLTTPQLIKKYGYPVEIHHVTTGDGYILEMHRIPRPGATPVYLQHGILDSSGGWVVAGPQTALAYMLYDAGYDVWLGNIRGSRYSRSHNNLSIKKSKYWDFTFHDMGSHDIPSMIDLILEKTSLKKMHYIGHSQGTTAFFVMCIQRPGYCDKIISMNALAPVAYMKNIQSPIIRTVSLFVDAIEILAKLIGVNEFLPNHELLTMGGQLFCKEHAITQDICTNVLFLITGYDSEQLNKTMLPAILGHIPAGTSTKDLVHFGQLVNSQKFRQYDYGWWSNLFTYYGKVSPPDYDLSKVKAPVALHYALNDWLAQPKDVMRIEKEVSNLIGSYPVPLPAFNHMDFLFAIDARPLLYNHVLKIMKDQEKIQKNT